MMEDIGETDRNRDEIASRDRSGGNSGRPAARAGVDAEQGRSPVDPWIAFTEPRDSGAFLSGWLALTVARLPDARDAALFLRIDRDRFGLAAQHGEFLEGDREEEAEKMVSTVADRGALLVEKASDGSLRIGQPISVDGVTQAVLLLTLSKRGAPMLQKVTREIYWCTGWLVAQLWQGQANISGDQNSLALLTLHLLAAADGHERFDGAANALVNAAVELMDFERAAIGMVRGRSVRLEALSHTAALKRHSELGDAIETAMEECVAQNRVIALPDSGEGLGPVDLAHRSLLKKTGDRQIVSAPLIVRGEPRGALLLLRNSAGSEAPDEEEYETIQLAAASIAPLLHAKYLERRWFSGRIRQWIHRGATAVLGRRPALALAALAAVVVLALPFLIQAPFRIGADASIQGAAQRTVVAPQDGFIDTSSVRAGDRVAKGDILATLDARDLRLEESRLIAATRRAQQDVRDALASGDRAASARASAELAEANAALRLARVQLQRLAIVAPSDGMIVSGDLSQRLGSPVSEGDRLFEIAQLDGWRAMIDVSEFDLAYVELGETGQLVLSSLPGRPIGFRISAVSSVSEPAEGENRFRVEAEIADPAANLRPGMEGIAKIEAGRASLAWIWTRGTLDRLRLWLWRLTA